MTMTDVFEFTLDEESEKKLYDILTDVNTEKTPSFTITDKYGHTAEYVKVVHGKWVHDGYDIPHGVDWMHCSNCGKRDVYCPASLTNYCPACGARMDIERKEENGK